MGVGVNVAVGVRVGVQVEVWVAVSEGITVLLGEGVGVTSAEPAEQAQRLNARSEKTIKKFLIISSR